MKTLPLNCSNNNQENLLKFLRLNRDQLINRLQYESAIFLSDKIIAISSYNSNTINIDDHFTMAHCMYESKQYQRSSYYIQQNGLHELDIRSCCLLIKCLLKIKKYKKASLIINECLNDIENGNSMNSISQNQRKNWLSTLYVLQSEIYESLDNRSGACKSLVKALERNFYCFEAFYRITHHHMSTKREELEILNYLIEKNSDSEYQLQMSSKSQLIMINFMIYFYYLQLKKYDKPDHLIVPKSFQIFNENLDFLIAHAERHFYNFDLIQTLEITSKLIDKDPHNFECLEIHISCLLSLEKSIELFKLSQNLIDLYPEHEISWYSLGCYYHLIKKKELSRRYLQKSVTLNNIFAPSWLLLGHSFSDDGEHDQVMATYFKASHLMPGCHLPLLYIGVEYARTENHKLGEKFIRNALKAAPEDPLVYNELSVTAFHSDELLAACSHLRQALMAIKYYENNNNINDNIDNSNNSSKNNFNIRIQYEPLFSNMGQIQRKLGRNKDALKFFKISLPLLPNDLSTNLSIGLVYCILDQYIDAVEYFDYAYGLSQTINSKIYKLDDIREALKDAIDFYPDNLKLPGQSILSCLPDLNNPIVQFNDVDRRNELAKNLAKLLQYDSQKQQQNNENNDTIESILKIR